MNEFTLEKETINILSLDILKFYHESAQKRLSDHRDQEKNTTERGYKLLSIDLGIVTALISYIYIHWNIENPIIQSLLALAIGIFLAAICMMIVVYPRLYIPLGRKPSEFRPNQMAPNLKGVKDDIQYKAILAKELSVLENAIKEQEKYNRRRAILFSFSFALIIAGIIASSVIFLISTIC